MLSLRPPQARPIYGLHQNPGMWTHWAFGAVLAGCLSVSVALQPSADALADYAKILRMLANAMALILVTRPKWMPLIIDPQMHANRWIQKRNKEIKDAKQLRMLGEDGAPEREAPHADPHMKFPEKLVERERAPKVGNPNLDVVRVVRQRRDGGGAPVEATRVRKEPGKSEAERAARREERRKKRGEEDLAVPCWIARGDSHRERQGCCQMFGLEEFFASLLG